MSSTNIASEQTGSTEPPLSIQDIIKRISELHKSLAREDKAEADSLQQTTVGTNSEQDGSNSGDVSQGNSDDTNKRDGDVSQENQEAVSKENNKKGKDVGQGKTDESNKRKEVLHELGKLCKELQYMISSFKKLENFETNLREPLKTLETNVKDILKDLPLVKVDELPKQVPLNLRVLRNNITRVKIQIPLQHQTANINSEANRALQTTVATREAEDLPHLYTEGIFESSYYFKEIEEKYNDLGIRQKLCLLWFAIFPENSEIKKRLLRFWWVGENLIPVKDPKDEMKFAGFFDYDPKGKPTMDFSSCKKACMVKSEGAPVSWFFDYLKEPGMEGLSADLVKLQMLFNFPDRQKLDQASQLFHELQTLFKMTGINVLYLGRWETSAARQRHIEVEDIDILKGLKNMKKLRLLSLQGISGIPKLPSTLCKLENLRILDLRACHNLEKLPDGIGSLKKLTYLDLSECYLLDDMPKQLNQLWELQVLKGFCGKALSKFQKLEKLKIAWGSEGLTGNNSTQDSSEQQSDPSNPNGREGKKQEKNAVKPKTTNQVSSAAKSSTEKENKGEDKGDDKKLKSGEANSKIMNQGEDKKIQNIGASKSMALKVSEQDNRRGLDSATKAILFVKKLKSLRREKKPKNAEGLEKLVKLDLQCFPRSTPLDWLVPQKMIGLTNLSIRGGRLGHLIQEGKEKWKVKTLRLKFLMDFKMNWKEMQERFPELNYLENVRCPRITFCPCDASGVWQGSSK
ncbi:hypothetical protein CRYUN_Cryun12cG0005600 [Craigia yunnanensis]